VSSEQRELERHSFVIKIWFEEEALCNSDQAKWRGHITHVASQKRRYVESLAGISEFINENLIAMGAGSAGDKQGNRSR